MSIYIKGMNLPVTCCHCPLMGYDPDREWYDNMARTGAHICVLTGELIDNTKREEHCPIIPVPEHGRLVDADALHEIVKERTKNWAGGWSDIECALTGNDIKEAPTIIPADKQFGNSEQLADKEENK